MRTELDFVRIVLFGVSSVDLQRLTSQHRSSSEIEKYVFNVLYVEVSFLLSKLTNI